jgi:hypothetical protein
MAESTQYVIKELKIITKNGTEVDIINLFEEINIFDTILFPVISGQILMTDAIGLSGLLLFDGSEGLLMHIKKSDLTDDNSFKKSFKIYKQTNRSNITPQSEQYILHFVSDEFLFSEQQRVNQHYQNTYSEIAMNILRNYLLTSENRMPIWKEQLTGNGFYTKSFGLKNVVIPNLKPIEAIQWCCKRAVDNLQAPDFLFFENYKGFNFASLSDMITKEAVSKVKYETKNIKGETPGQEMEGARSFEVITQTDFLQRTKSGVNAGKFVGFDPITKKIQETNISYNDWYEKTRNPNAKPNYSIIENRDGSTNLNNYNSRKTVSLFTTARKNSKYIQSHEPFSLTTDENQNDFLFQRKSIIENLLSKRLKVVMPGNFFLSSGFNVDVDVPYLGAKSSDVSNKDISITGKYLIIASRHVIGLEKFETIIETATTSNDFDFIASNNNQQVQEIEDY